MEPRHIAYSPFSRGAGTLTEFNADEDDWAPLEKVLPLEWCAGFMFMGCWGDIRLYKHGFTRYYLNLDSKSRAYAYVGERYVRTNLECAIERVFEGIEEMGETRSSAFDDDAIRRRHAALAEAGWTVVSLGHVESEKS